MRGTGVFSGSMDVDEFMAFLETRPDEERWHLIEGVAVMMPPPSVADQRIVSNLCHLLNTAFDASPLDLFAYPGLGVRTPSAKNFQPEPDVVVLPGVAGYNLYSENFCFVAEVLSPSNSRTEIDLKLRRYREAPENLYAVVIEPREFMVEIHARRRVAARRAERPLRYHRDAGVRLALYGRRTRSRHAARSATRLQKNCDVILAAARSSSSSPLPLRERARSQPPPNRRQCISPGGASSEASSCSALRAT
jgi:Uma2 family endonuclease